MVSLDGVRVLLQSPSDGVRATPRRVLYALATLRVVCLMSVCKRVDNRKREKSEVRPGASPSVRRTIRDEMLLLSLVMT